MHSLLKNTVFALTIFIVNACNLHLFLSQIKFIELNQLQNSLNSSTLEFSHSSLSVQWISNQHFTQQTFIRVSQPFFFSTGEMSTNFSVDRVDLNTSGTNLTCDYFVYQRAGVIIFPIFYSLVFLISVCGNSLVLYVTCQKKQKLNSTSIYMVNLAVSDVLFTLVLPGRVTYYIRQFDWPFGDLLCRLATMLFFSNTYAGKMCVCTVCEKLLNTRTAWPFRI